MSVHRIARVDRPPPPESGMLNSAFDNRFLACRGPHHGLSESGPPVILRSTPGPPSGEREVAALLVIATGYCG